MTLAAASLLRNDRKVPRTAVALLRMTWRSWTVLQILPRVEREELAYEKRKERSRVTIEAQQREDAGPSAGEPASSAQGTRAFGIDARESATHEDRRTLSAAEEAGDVAAGCGCAGLVQERREALPDAH